MNIYEHKEPFQLEDGSVLHNLKIAYHTYGSMNTGRDNVIWICHALTASSDVQSWWPGMVGEGKIFDTSKYFIVCANIIGSCYGSTGPLSNDLKANQPYYHHFPFITIHDMVAAHRVLGSHLGIKSIEILAGGSMGGYQVLEWSLIEPEFIKRLLLVATSAKESAWGIAIHTAQRLAIEADATWNTSSANAGAKGLKAARAIGMLTYRSYKMYKQKQTDDDKEKVDGFKASSYIEYQGDKLVARFNAYSYWLLTKAMDSHNVCRKRDDSVEKVLNGIKQSSLVIGVSSDYLCPVEEQQLLAKHIPNAKLVEIDSDYGHDGFLVETEKISYHVNEWLKQDATKTL